MEFAYAMHLVDRYCALVGGRVHRVSWGRRGVIEVDGEEVFERDHLVTWVVVYGEGSLLTADQREQLLAWLGFAREVGDRSYADSISRTCAGQPRTSS